MFASATSGDKPNNSKFSICSVGNISQVLDAVHEGKKKNCFSGNFSLSAQSSIEREGRRLSPLYFFAINHVKFILVLGRGFCSLVLIFY